MKTTKTSENKNYILTGCTGILGSHIMYELMSEIHSNDYKGDLVLLIRSKKEVTIEQRFKELLTENVVPEYLQKSRY